jgi:hypothetical protein
MLKFQEFLGGLLKFQVFLGYSLQHLCNFREYFDISGIFW